MEAHMSEWRIEVTNEWQSRDPFGELKSADVTHASFDVGDASGAKLTAARNGYASFWLQVAGKGGYELSAEPPAPLEIDLFRAWYHKMAEGGKYLVDALVPVGSAAKAQLPDPDNAIDGQTHQEYWVDVFIPADAPVGETTGRIVLTGGGSTVELPVTVAVLEAVISDEDAALVDHNSYGHRWTDDYFPSLFADCADEDERDAVRIDVLHQYYRICHEHRANFSNLGYGHHGGYDRIYGPRSTGSGRTKSLSGWEWYDRHYGPLLDGSVFATAGAGAPPARRPARPVWGVYTNINAGWPGDYLYWGQPGYEVEFNRCIGQFDAHYREKGWLTTRPFFFFNHKKRFRWYEWDGDEPKHAKDHVYWREVGRMFKAAVGETLVPWAFRADASWQMANEWAELAGIVDYWVCGGFFRWYPEESRIPVERGDTVWTYSGSPAIDAPSSAVLEHVWRIWARGIAGHCDWLSTRPDADVWNACEGALICTIYPGERFGIAGPIPSTRLKLKRNAVQDINLIDAAARSAGTLDETRKRLIEAAGLTIWEDPPPVVTERPPEEWDSQNLSVGSQDDNMSDYSGQDPLWWSVIRNAALSGEVKS